MKIFASSSNYLIRIVDNADEDEIRDYLQYKSSYISALSPFIEISGPDSECDDVMLFLDDLGLRYKVY